MASARAGSWRVRGKGEWVASASSAITGAMSIPRMARALAARLRWTDRHFLFDLPGACWHGRRVVDHDVLLLHAVTGQLVSSGRVTGQAHLISYGISGVSKSRTMRPRTPPAASRRCASA